ncbi:MAG: cytochrome ubiquinol oxidase subunit I [Austwickia sp.]|nr:cytochrome ubiquinol oxidase subunit I [Austwickia sp.]MBK8437066.1 cytochrome ubiquinol oxidase subunit I [Austwickia sp.]
MDALDLARWQFAITTVYHFLFVPITIGMSALVAGFHTAWVRTHNPQLYRLTRFFGKLFVINFALGLVTGIVQEFQFGMNWSDYSRFVGDIFGAPLAFEALLTFFLESTFLGLWLFGWGKLPEKLHAATMWLVHIGTVMSAYFILAANSFMQNPVGFTYNPQTKRAEMADFVAVLTNKVQLVTFPHVITAAYMTGGAVVMAVALWHLRRSRVGADAERSADLRSMYRTAAKVGAVVTLIASIGVVVTGDLQGKVMTEVQPMKMAAAEALYETESNAGFSIFTIGTLDGSREVYSLKVPGLLSFLGTGTFNGTIEGISDLREQMQQQYGGQLRTRDDVTQYTPNIPATYWSFRLMMGLGFVGIAISLLALWALRSPKGATEEEIATQQTARLAPRWWHHAILWAPLLPLLANSFGWIFTELGRQPWIVHGQMTTATGVSPSVSSGEVLLSMVVFTLLYGVLAVIEVKLFLKYVRMGAEAVGDPGAITVNRDEDAPLVYAY